MMSESHQRQMLLVAERPGKYVDNFSKEFKSTFLTLLKQRFGVRRVSANVVYNEYISGAGLGLGLTSDKQHIHMNSTQWRTLTSFVNYLGHEGICIVEETPKGMFLTYIERDPEVPATRHGSCYRCSTSRRSLRSSIEWSATRRSVKVCVLLLGPVILPFIWRVPTG